MHNLESPLEFLTPFAPASKLIRKRSAVEEYVATEAIGTGSAFWDRPVDNFFKPFGAMAGYKMGMSGIPESVKKRREVSEYFDMLKWAKANALEQRARNEGDKKEAQSQAYTKSRTVFGTDVFGSPSEVMKALPRRERDFFQSFSEARTTEEREQIMELIPESERRIYASQWMRQEADAAMAKKEAGIATKADDRKVAIAIAARKSEGFMYSKDSEEQWMQQTGGEMPFDDWIRQQKAAQYFQENSMPGADWIGWHPSVDLEDIKLKYVDMAGLDHHDFDLWGDRKRMLARKPYINNEAIDQMDEMENYNATMKAVANARSIAATSGNRDSRVVTHKMERPGGNDYRINVRDGRQSIVDGAYKQFGA